MDKRLSPGTILSHYRIVSKIGEGGMGEVYLADDTKLERQIALKILPADVAADAERIGRFVREAKAASALNHPNILTVFEIGSFEGSQYIATEFIRGETLRDLMNHGRMNLNEALGISLQVAAALSAAHEAGIVHRDIKPENIMMRDDGLVKVLDFGLAKLAEKRADEASLEDETKALFSTQPGIVMGTVAYMSPEQARGREIDARSDIFSLGIVMYEMFAGKRPFEGESHLDLISSILKDDPPPLPQVAPELPRQLGRIVGKTLRKDRGHRYQHVKDLQIDVEDLRDELKFEAKLNKSTEITVQALPLISQANDPKPTLTSSIAATRRFTLLHAIAFAVVAAGIIVAVWIYSSRRNLPANLPGSYKTTEVATWSSAPGELFSHASFSPDGKMIAFASTKSGTKNIWVTQTGSTEAIQVTNDGFANVDPIWSPKGDEIAYFSVRGNSTGVWRVPALGGTPKSIGSPGGGGGQLRRWTQSGKIYYQLENELHSIEVASGTSQKITSFGQEKVRFIDISADERSIVYTTQNDDIWRILISDVAGTAKSEVVKGLGMIDELVWLSDKNRLFYGATVDGVVQTFFTEVGSGQSARVTASETDSSVVAAAPDGKSIIVTTAKEESNLWRVSASDGRESPLIRDLNSKLWPAVSPDNQKFVFQSVKNLSQGNKLYETAIATKALKSADDSERPIQLAERGFLPAWAPDGSVIAFLRKDADKAELISANPNGGSEKVLTSGGVATAGYSVSPYNYTQTKAFAWSPDSLRIAYVSMKSGASNIWIVRPREGQDEMLTDNMDGNTTFVCPMWSADNNRIAFSFQRKGVGENARSTSGLGLIDTATRQTAFVYETQKIFRLIGWTADENGMIVAEPDKSSGLPPETVLKRIAIANGAESVLATLKNIYYYNIFLSDDRKNIAYAARAENRDDIWVIPSAGGAPRKLTDNNDSGLYFSRLAWLHDGSAIVFGKQTRFSLLSMITDID